MITAITGATGHIGINLVRLLKENGRQVRCLIHLHNRGLEDVDGEMVSGDVRDVESLVNAFQGAEVVYHLASRISLSMKDWDKVKAVNIDGTRNVIEACRRAGVRRLVHFSSIHALRQEPFSQPVDENRSLVDMLAPPYDRSKAASERDVLQAVHEGLDAVIISPTAVIGPYDCEPSFFGDALLRIANKKLPALVGAGFDWVDARDVAAGAVAAEEKAAAGSKYLLSGQWVSIPDIAMQMEEIIGNACTRRSVPLWLAAASAPLVELYCKITKTRPLYTRMSLSSLRSNRHISHEKAARELGYSARPFRESLTDTMNWFAEAGMLGCKLPEGGFK